MKKEISRIKHYMGAVLFVLFGVILDQLTKYLAIIKLKDNEPFVIIKNVFQLEYLENRGAAFGLFQDQRLFFYSSVIIVCVLVAYFYKKVPLNSHYLPLRLCALMIVTGALGNFIDRIRFNYVVDFFYFKLIDFPIFNVADIYVTVATFLFILFMLFYYKEEDLEGIFHS